jgi:hypothetical protein
MESVFKSSSGSSRQASFRKLKLGEAIATIPSDKSLFLWIENPHKGICARFNLSWAESVIGIFSLPLRDRLQEYTHTGRSRRSLWVSALASSRQASFRKLKLGFSGCSSGGKVYCLQIFKEKLYEKEV